MKHNDWAIGVDIGGTKIDISHVDNQGKIIEQILLATDYKKGFDQIKDNIISAINQLRLKAATPPVGIGIGIAGQVEAKTGIIHFAPNLEWRHVPLKKAIEDGTQLRTVVTNDVRAALWGEWLHGAGKGYRNLVCVFIGTGIGGGVVVDGSILEGSKNSAGEIGHMTIDINGPKCTCGNIGCYEALCAGWAIAKRATDSLQNNSSTKSTLNELKTITGKDVIEASHNGDTFAKNFIQQIMKEMGAGIVSLVNIFNPECIILGGGVIHGLPEALDIINSHVKQNALNIASSSLKIVPTQLKASSGAIGAATYALYMLNPDSFKR